VVLAESAASPMAVLLKPVVLLKSAVTPTAVLRLPVVLAVSVLAPMAVFGTPVVRVMTAPLPMAVLVMSQTKLQASGTAGTAFCSGAAGASAKQASISGMTRKPSRRGDRSIDVFKLSIFIFSILLLFFFLLFVWGHVRGLH